MKALFNLIILYHEQQSSYQVASLKNDDHIIHDYF